LDSKSEKVSSFQGFKPWSFQIGATESLLMPMCSAIDRVLQCIDPSSGSVFMVSATTSATVPSGSHDVRPRPGAITPIPSTPSFSKRRRHWRTEFDATPTRRATS